MQFRTTAQINTNQAIRYITNHSATIVNYQRQISSGLKLHRSSDDPVSFHQVTSLTTQLQQLESDSYAIVDAETKLNTSVSTIQQAQNLLVKAKTLAQQGVQSTSDSERNALAVEVEGLLASMKDISKTQSAGSFLYSGSKSNTEPYEFGEPLVAGGPIRADYVGATDSSSAFIGLSVSIETFYQGTQIFGASQRGELLVLGDTGAKTGAGTDSIIGRASLLVQHTLTTFAGASGVAPGASSAARDTVLGPAGANNITIDDTSGTGDFGTVVLNNGEQFNWTRSDVDLQIVGEDGREIYLDMSSIAAGFSGSVSLTSDGTLSVDGGLTSVAIDFSASQTLIDSTTGRQTHIDTTEVTQTGTDHLEYPGTANVFQALHELAQDLRNTRGLDSQAFADSLDRRLGELGNLADNMLHALGQQSASLQALDELEIRVQNLQLEVETQVNNFQATDIPEAVLRMQNEQSLLEFTYSVTAQIASTSLIDFLR